MLLVERPIRSSFLFDLLKFVYFCSLIDAVSASGCTASNVRMLR